MNDDVKDSQDVIKSMPGGIHLSQSIDDFADGDFEDGVMNFTVGLLGMQNPRAYERIKQEVWREVVPPGKWAYNHCHAEGYFNE